MQGHLWDIRLAQHGHPRSACVSPLSCFLLLLLLPHMHSPLTCLIRIIHVGTTGVDTPGEDGNEILSKAGFYLAKRTIHEHYSFNVLYKNDHLV